MIRVLLIFLLNITAVFAEDSSVDKALSYPLNDSLESQSQNQSNLTEATTRSQNKVSKLGMEPCISKKEKCEDLLGKKVESEPPSLSLYQKGPEPPPHVDRGHNE